MFLNVTIFYMTILSLFVGIAPAHALSCCTTERYTNERTVHPYREGSGISSTQQIDATVTSLSLSQAIAMVEERFNASAVKTATVQEDGKKIYVIRLLSANKARVWTVRVDAVTGELL